MHRGTSGRGGTSITYPADKMQDYGTGTTPAPTLSPAFPTA